MDNFKTLVNLDFQAQRVVFNSPLHFRDACENCINAPSFDTILGMFGLTVTQGHNVKRNGHYLNRNFLMILDHEQRPESYHALESRYLSNPVAIFKHLDFYYGN